MHLTRDVVILFLMEGSPGRSLYLYDLPQLRTLQVDAGGDGNFEICNWTYSVPASPVTIVEELFHVLIISPAERATAEMGPNIPAPLFLHRFLQCDSVDGNILWYH